MWKAGANPAPTTRDIWVWTMIMISVADVWGKCKCFGKGKGID
jgi:hypothetical protein